MKKKNGRLARPETKAVHKKESVLRTKLDQANKELQIEAGLEKVRVFALKMTEPADMLKICKTISHQLTRLGIGEIRNVQTAIFYKEKGTYMNYEYYAKHNKALITEVSFTNNIMHKRFASKMLKGKGEFFTTQIKGKKNLNDWISYQKTTNVFIDKYIKTASSLNYYWYSLGPVALGISTYHPLTETDKKLFRRFLNVFELAYRRYLDIEKAEAQAREAEIQLALERIRGRTMAMQSSNEFPEVAALLFQQVKSLGIETYTSGFNIWDKTHKNLISWMSNPRGTLNPAFEMPIHSYEQHERIYNSWKKNESFFEDDLKGKALIKHYKFLRSFPLLDEAFTKSEKAGIRTPERQVHNNAFFSEGYLLFITTQPCPQHHNIFKRLAKVFDQTYTRFLDLQKAEAQAREAQVEAALERLRSRSMAMYRSEELSDVVLKLFKSLGALGFDSTVCNLALVDKKKKISKTWTAHKTRKGISTYFVSIPFLNSPFYKALINAYDKQIPFSVHELAGQKLKAHTRELFEKTDYSHVPEEVKKANKRLAESKKPVVVSVAAMKYGLLTSSRSTSLNKEEAAILQRFAKVFEQTYTRFLDLQKAEAQAREAEIQLALERVRARTMAMQKPQELDAVIKTVYAELKQLDISFERCFIMIFDEQKGATWWMGSHDDHLFHEGFYVQYHTHPPHLAYLKGWEERQQKWEYRLEGQVKKDWDEFIFTETELSKLPPVVIDYMKSFEFAHLAASFENFGCMTIGGGERLSEKSFDILSRFTKVFDVTYTRFLDLQKAEAQAREAEIQLALERVRARTMAMQKSEELQQVVSVLYEQLDPLGLTELGCELILCDDQNEILEFWHTNPVQTQQHCYKCPKSVHPFFKKQWNAWKKQESGLIIKLTVKEQQDLNDVLFEQTGFKDAPDDTKKFMRGIKRSIFFSHTVMKYGLMEAVGYKPLTENNFNILDRFTKSFEQTYTRFLDLQKAETQAKEAEIQLALERVRARTMAMQKSEELPDAAAVLFQQFKGLGQELMQMTIGVIQEDKGITEFSVTDWSGSGAGVNRSFNLSNDEPTLISKMFAGWKQQKKSIVVNLAGKELEDWLTYRNTMSGVTIHSNDSGGRRVIASAFFSKGHLSFSSPAPPPVENVQLLERFANVFEQTYTRFLDLKRAEVQAREAEIQLALERVRARTIAMHKSDELREVVGEFFRQVQSLGIEIQMFVIFIFKPEGGMEWWGTGFGEEGLPQSYDIPLLAEFSSHPRARNLIEIRKNKTPYQVFELSGEEKKSWDQFLLEKTGLEQLPENIKKGMRSLNRIVLCDSVCDHGILEVAGQVALSIEHENILRRFAKVFEQTYTRFLDVQKAEAQTREAKIEAALEKVRSRSLAMHKAEELGEVATVVFEKLRELDMPVTDGVAIVTHVEGSKDQVEWMENPGMPSAMKFFQPYYEHPILADYWNAKNDGLDYIAPRYTAEQSRSFFKHIFEHTDYKYTPQEIKDYCLAAETYSNFAAFQKNSSIFINNFSGRSLSQQEIDIVKRFSKVFEQAYVRFLDLQKAELQAREAQIEAALERVRSKAMAMHSSKDLLETIKVFYQQLKSLNVIPRRCGIALINKDLRLSEVTTMNTTDEGDSIEVIGHIKMSGHKILEEVFENWLAQKEYHAVLKGNEIKEYYRVLKPQISYPDYPHDMIQFGYYFMFTEGDVYAWTDKELTEEDLNIFRRFTTVISLTYKRFLDLQKAEMQAREAEIQLALERIRARTMAMQRSDELLDVITIFSEQLANLKIHFDNVSFGINIHEDDFKFWLSALGAPHPIMIHVPYLDNPAPNRVMEAQEKGLKFFSDVLTKEENQHWINHLMEHSEIKFYPDKVKEFLLNSPGFARSTFILNNINLYVGNYSCIPYTDEENKIFERFSYAFEQSYTRFLDLQKAEAQAREAQIEAGLERVRSASLSMETTGDLQKVVDIVFVELNRIEIGMDHTAIVTLIEGSKDYNVWVGSADANFTTVSRIPYNSLTQVQRDYNEMIENRPTLLSKIYTGETKKEYSRYLFSQTGFKDNTPEKELRLMMDGDSLITSIVMLENTGIQIVSYKGHRFSESDEKILSRFTNVFEQAYIRFLDLQFKEEQAEILRQEKVKLEKTLSELQAAQKQLIQTEKMASLGELTAGIAHEIQNPLNFVNNFSDVSNELLEEMKEELAKGNTQIAAEIANDIKQNLEKILHHGKRADGIVKSMLQHSRASSGKEELTDINALADEYLRLAYHGLRAKDKSLSAGQAGFNAKFETDFDESIGKINIVPQEMGRVLLNLINNAFYACTERSRSAGNENYEPTVLIRTKKMNGNLEIRVKDNGTGIPQNVLDRIFQPFFTTKPTGQGTGLGLSLSYDIIKAHGGELKVETKEGEGSVFIVLIPYV